MRIELMAIQTEHFKTEVRWKPWKAMAVAAGAGSGIMVAIMTLLLRSTGR
jgi:hypothetical protein